ncbi:hypothetical protein EV401DRAFT_519889 [Pisolithus croceorrhizus]|nr:hypothetical protein EV401DRAFT_519889 [Pisolithus croceorrhizus]
MSVTGSSRPRHGGPTGTHLGDSVTIPRAYPEERATASRQLDPPRPPHDPARTVVNPTRPGINTVHRTQTWSEWLGSMFDGLFALFRTTTSTTAPAAPAPNTPQQSPPPVVLVSDTRQEPASSAAPLPNSRQGPIVPTVLPDTQQEPITPAIPVPDTQREALPTAAPARLTGHVCVVCMDLIRGSEIRAPCGHYYGIPCIIDLFQNATRDESLFPPRCCRQNIPFDRVQTHLSRALVAEFQEKSREFGTVTRVYCARQTCSRFLGPLIQNTSGTTVYDCPAPNCETRTCANCRGQYDERTHSCQQDRGAEQVLELGRAEGWARCPGCSQLIELDMGCFHMTCRCRTEFCYLCKERWKTCSCPEWDGRQLIAVAQQRVDAQLRGGQHFHPFLHGWGPLPDPAWLQPYPPPGALFLGAQPAPADQPRVPPAPANPPAVPLVAPDGRVRNSKRRSGNRRTANVGTVNIGTLRQRMIHEMTARLRVDHDCQHLNWQYREGGGRCEHCHHALPSYLYRCPGCEMLVCNRCRRNRL